MTTPESKRLIVVEQKQKEMTVHIANLTKSVEDINQATLKIQSTLDELTGARKVMVWFISFLVGAGMIVATIYEALKDAHH